MIRTLHLILFFIFGIISSQTWAYSPATTTTNQSYDYGTSEYFYIDNNVGFEAQLPSYDVSRYFYIDGNTE